jgi:hypothetical protein
MIDIGKAICRSEDTHMLFNQSGDKHDGCWGGMSFELR